MKIIRRILRKTGVLPANGKSRSAANNALSPHQEFMLTKAERVRLRNTPRYVPTTTTFFERPMAMVDACTFLAGMKEIFEKGIYEFNASGDNPYIIDCGANIGLSIIYFKRLYPNASIIAYEPDPTICATLQKNVLNFGFTNVEVRQEAIWTANGTISFQVEGGFSGRIPKPEDQANLVTVQSSRLKDLLQNRPVDFLKIDIEGAEYRVLKDCRQALGNVQHIFIEYHSHHTERQTLNEILTILTENNFRYHIHEAYTRPKPYVQRELMLGMDLQLDIFGYR